MHVEGEGAHSVNISLGSGYDGFRAYPVDLFWAVLFVLRLGGDLCGLGSMSRLYALLLQLGRHPPGQY